MAPGKQPTSNKDAYLFRPSHLISKRKRGLICEHSFAMIQSRLNMQHGSIVIIAEHQWNSNAEMQAISRAYRQGQEKVVKAIILDGVNSDIDQIIKVSKTRKMPMLHALSQDVRYGPGSHNALDILGLNRKKTCRATASSSDSVERQWSD